MFLAVIWRIQVFLAKKTFLKISFQKCSRSVLLSILTTSTKNRANLIFDGIV